MDEIMKELEQQLKDAEIYMGTRHADLQRAKYNHEFASTEYETAKHRFALLQQLRDSYNGPCEVVDNRKY